jgi:hypothetical protein
MQEGKREKEKGGELYLFPFSFFLCFPCPFALSLRSATVTFEAAGQVAGALLQGAEPLGLGFDTRPL